MDLTVGVGVAAPVIVAALVNRNVPVKVIDAVDDQGSMSFVSWPAALKDVHGR